MDLLNISYKDIKNIYKNLNSERFKSAFKSNLKKIGIAGGKALIVTAISKSYESRYGKNEFLGRVRGNFQNDASETLLTAISPKKKQRDRDNVLYEEIMSFVSPEKDLEDCELIEIETRFPEQHAKLIRTVLYEFCSEQCSIKKDFLKCDYSSNRLKKVAPFDESLGENFSKKSLNNACYFITYQDRRYVVTIKEDMSHKKGGNLTIFADNHDDYEVFKEDFIDFLKTNNYMKNQIIDSNGEILDISDCPTWEDISLPEEFKEQIRYNTIQFIQNTEKLKERGLRATRGNLWQGSPGVGKTLTAKIIAKESKGKATFLSLAGSQLTHASHVKQVFEFARWMKPVILFFDDIDRVSSDVRDALLYELDGINNNDDMVVIATANNIGYLGDALANRPNRFDVVLEFQKPNAEERAKFFQKILSYDGFEGISNSEYTLLKPDTNDFYQALLHISQETNDLSYIHCEEIIRRVRIHSICKRQDDKILYLSELEKVSKQIKKHNDEYKSALEIDNFDYREKPSRGFNDFLCGTSDVSDSGIFE